MKKRLFGIVSVIMMLAMLASCGVNTRESDIEAAKNTVIGMVNTIKSGNLDGIEDYFINNGDLKDDIDELKESFDFKKNFVGGMGDAAALFGEEKIDEMVEKLVVGVLGKINCRIDSADIDNGDASRIKISATMSIPSADDMDIDDFDVEGMMMEIFGISSPEELATKWMEKEGLSLEDFVQKYATANQDDIAKAMMESFAPEMDAFIDKLFNEIIDAAKPEEENGEFILEKVGSEWKIAEMN